MKKLILLTIICTLISGCGLFRKKTKQVDISKSEQTSDVRVKAELDYTDNSKSVEVITSFQREFTIGGYIVSADSIIFNSDGSFKAKGNAKMSGDYSSGKSVNDSTSKVVESDVKLQSKSDSTDKKKEKHYDKEVVTESEPSGKAFIYGAVAVLIVVIGFLWWFLKGMRKKIS
jgi:cobalamin biosynthesis Mg chelatase CobN